MRTRVLLIENGHSGRSVLSQLFGLGGLTVYAFSSVKEAEDHLEEGAFDIALIDGELPGECGIVAADELISRCPSTRVMLMVQDADAAATIGKRCPGVEMVIKSVVGGGVLSKVGAGVGAGYVVTCNN